MLGNNAVMREAHCDANGDRDRDLDLEQGTGKQYIRMNPRLVWNDPDDFFGKSFFNDLLMEQQEGA